MPPKMKVYNIDVRSHDRDTSKYPSANDFVVDLGFTYYNVTSLKLGSLEVPKTRFSLEEKENAMYFSEGLAIGDAVMETALNTVSVTIGEQTTEVTIPATLMPVKTFQQNNITTQQNHGLQKYMEWCAQDPKRPRPMLVGAQPGSKATAAHRVGFFLDQIPNLSFPTPDTIALDEGYVESMAIGASTTGYVHVPPLHLHEILSLMTYASGLQWSLREGAVQVGYDQHAAMKIQSVRSPGKEIVSLGQILGFRYDNYPVARANAPPYVPRARVPAGFYANPPSLLANATEEAIMNRCLFTSEASFKITQMDAFFSERVKIPQGVYTPELLAQTLRGRVTDTHFILEHVDADGQPDDRYIRWTVESAEGFPFTLDFSEASAVAASRAMGFRQRRYTGSTKYMGTAYAVSGTRNALPCPPPSPHRSAQNGDLLNATQNEFRYPRGVYTITGTTPSQQRFSLFCEPGESWAVPNRGTAKTYYESVRGKGIIDITTRAMAKQVSYGFRRGDVMRLTGISQESVSLSSFVDVGTKALQINNEDVLNGVVAIVANKMGGQGYIEAPAVTIVTEPEDGASRPSITAVVRHGKVVAFQLEDSGARFDRIPTISIAKPQSFTVNAAEFAFQSDPERKVLTLTLSDAPSAGATAGKGLILTGSSGLDRAYEVVSVDGTTVVVSQENLDNVAIAAQDAVGAAARFSVSDLVPVAGFSQGAESNTVSLSGSMAEATIGSGIIVSTATYNAAPVSITGLNGGTFEHGDGTLALAAGDRLLLRGTASDGVWEVASVDGQTFTLSGGGPASITADAKMLRLGGDEAEIANVNFAVAKPLSRPTASFESPVISNLPSSGFGGVAVYSPSQEQAHARCTMFDDSIESVLPSIPGFLNASSSVDSLSSSGAPKVTLSGGSTTTDVFNTRAQAEASSVLLAGELVAGNDARVEIDGESYPVLYGEFESETTLKVVVGREVQQDTSNAATLNNFYFDNTYATWEKSGNEITLTNVDGDGNARGWASIELGGQPVNYTTAPLLLPSTMLVEWGGQYTDAAGVEASVSVTNNISTRVGICTYAGYENKYFRYLIEYNAAGVNSGRGFYDSISGNNNIVLTFSRISAPRVEYFGESSSAMHRLTKEGRMLTRFQNQILLYRLGVVDDRFGDSTYVAQSQWYLDNMPYRLLQFLDEGGAHLGASEHVHIIDENTSPVFAKLIFPSAYNNVRWQAFEIQFDTPRNLSRIRIRLLDFDESLYPLHGRELTFSVLLTANPERH
jgi:hypothetical protein